MPTTMTAMMAINTRGATIEKMMFCLGMRGYLAVEVGRSPESDCCNWGLASHCATHGGRIPVGLGVDGPLGEDQLTALLADAPQAEPEQQRHDDERDRQQQVVPLHDEEEEEGVGSRRHDKDDD